MAWVGSSHNKQQMKTMEKEKEAQLRLECLRLARDLITHPKFALEKNDVVKLAEKLYQFTQK